MKIEKVIMSVPRSPAMFDEFVKTLARLKQGESFKVANLPASWRTAVSAIQKWSGLRFTTRKEKDGYRIFRL